MPSVASFRYTRRSKLGRRERRRIFQLGAFLSRRRFTAFSIDCPCYSKRYVSFVRRLRKRPTLIPLRKVEREVRVSDFPRTWFF